jgi:hypothetical protein
VLWLEVNSAPLCLHQDHSWVRRSIHTRQNVITSIEPWYLCYPFNLYTLFAITLFIIITLNFADEWLAPPLHILEVTVLNPGLETNCHD